MSSKRNRKIVYCQNCMQRRASIKDLFCPACGVEYGVVGNPPRRKCKNTSIDCQNMARAGHALCDKCQEFYAGVRDGSA
jgi:hypothetical protein